MPILEKENGNYYNLWGYLGVIYVYFPKPLTLTPESQVQILERGIPSPYDSIIRGSRGTTLVM